MNAEPHSPPSPAADQPRPIAGDLAFWLFTLLAFALFAPCVILPVKQEHERIHAERDRLAEQVADLAETVRRNDQALQAVQQDPSILEHLAVHELNLPRPGEQRLRVQPREVPLPPAADDAIHQPASNPPTTLFAHVPKWLGKADWEAVFCEPPTRQSALIAAACSALIAVLIMVVGSGRR